MKTKMVKVASFLTGIGGQALGFQQAGGELVYVNEIYPPFALTCEENLNVAVDTTSVLTLVPSELPDFDVMISDIPHAEVARTKWNPLADALVNIIEVKRPLVVCFEIYTLPNKLSHFVSDLETLGYTVHHQTLSYAEQSGLPLYGKKDFIIAFRDIEQAKRWVPLSPIPCVSINEIVGKPQNHQYYLEKDSALDPTLVTLIPSELGIYGIKYKGLHLKKVVDVYSTHLVRVPLPSLNRPCQVIRDEKGVRRFTIDELRAVKGLPSDFRFQLRPTLQPQSFREQYVQMIRQLFVCSSVPMLKRVAESIYHTF